MIEIKAFAKINLTLSVGPKRRDGYHEVDTLMHRISLCDTIQLEKSETLSLSVSDHTLPKDENNLMWKAAVVFFTETGIAEGVSMSVVKKIPAKAGLGGGSADAAAVIKGLHSLYGLPFSRDLWIKKSASLGADVPFCFMKGAALATGIGATMTPLSTSLSVPLLLVKPPVSISTKEAYRIMDENPRRHENRTLSLAKAWEETGTLPPASLYNDFETILCPRNPCLQEVIAWGQEIGHPAHLSGSGSAFFFLCDRKEEAKQLATKAKKEHPDWFTAVATTL